MITVETIELNGVQYKRTCSDTYTITRDGVEYTEAIDPYDSDRVYEETETKLEDVLVELDPVETEQEETTNDEEMQKWQKH